MKAPKSRERIPVNGLDWGAEIEAPVTCKHGGLIRCRECGTGERDGVHRTVGGMGVVARLARAGRDDK